HFDSVAWYAKAARVQKKVYSDLSSANKELERLIPRFVSKPMRRLLKAKRAYEIQKIDFIAYLREIAGLAIEQTGGISFSVDYPGLANAVRALDSKQAQAIEEVRKLAARDLWRELEQLEAELHHRFLKTDIEKSLIAFYDKINSLKRLNKIEMTASEYERVKSTIAGLHTQELANFIAQHGKNTVVLSREWEEEIRYALGFYETALERDGAVRVAAEAFIKNPDEQIAVLVYGGFHTGRIRETLQSLGATYAIVSPRITRTDKAHEDRYRSLMSADQPGLIDKKTNQLSRPLSAFELMNAGSPERSAIVSQVKVLRAVMSGLPAQRTLSQTVRDAELKLKWRHRHSPTQPGFFSAKSEVRVLEDEIKIADEVLTRAEIELRMEKQGFPELKLLWDTFKTMTVWEGWRLRLMRFEDIDETALSAARVNHMGGWLVRPLLMLILMGSASYLLSAFWSYSVESLVGEGGNLIQALRGVLQEPINVIELGLGAFSIYLGVLWIKRTVISSWKKISALDLARMLSKRSYRQWFDQTEKATAVMSRLETLGVNALWDDVFYRKYYRSAASVVEEVPLPDAHTVHDVLRNVLGQVNAHGYQRGIYTTSLKHGRKTVADFAREHKKEMELSKKGQLAPELGVQLLKRLLTEHLHENSSGYRYVAKAIRNIEVEDYLPDGAVEVRVWERSPWTDLNRAEDFYSSASLRSNQFMDYLKRRSKGMLGSFGYLRNKSISALDFRTKEGRSIRVRMAAVTYKTKAGELRPMLFVDAVEGRLGVKLRLIKKAIEDYAQAAGFDGVFYYKFALNTVPQKFVTYVAEQGVPVEELDIAYVDASERQYLDAFSYVYEPFEYVYPKGKILGHVVDFKEPGMRDPVNPSAAYVFWGKVKKRYARWTLNIAAMGLAGVVLAQNNRQLLLPLGIAAGLTLLYELGLGKKALKRDQTKDVQPRRSEVRAEDFIAAIRRTVESDAYARQMQYAQRFDKKAQKLLVYFPKPTKSLKPFFEEVLLNASIKDTDLENVLKFLNSIKDPEQKESTESLIAVIWPSSDKTLGPIGLSVEKGARDKRRTELFAKLDSVRKFVKAASLSKREIKQVGKLQKKLGLDISHVLDMVSISPTLLRGLKKAPRPIYAWIIPTLLAAAFNTAIFLLFPHISITVPGLVIALGTIIPGTYFVSTQLPIAPGVLYYPKIKKFFRQLIQGDRPVSEINRSLEQLGVRTDEFRKHREYENAAAGVRVVVRDKRQLEDAVKFLTSSEDIDNCIALRNFVAWALPSLLDDDGIVLADLYSKGTSKRYAHRGQMWMMAAEEAGEPVLVVNSFEFNDEGAKYTDVLMPEAINALQDVAQKAGFKKIYTGITEYAREYLDRHYKQGESKNLIRKVHSAREAGFKYQFDVFALTYSLSRKGFTRDYVYQKKRSLTVRAYALIFGLIEFFKGNKAKTRSFWEAAVNPNNFWEIPLVDFTRSEIRSPSDSSPTDDGLGRLKSLRDGGDSTRSEMRASEARTEGRSQGSDAKLPPVLRVTGGAGEIEDFIKKNSRDGAQALADKLVSVELTNNEMGGYQLVFDLVFAPELGRATIQMTRKWDEPTVVREVKFETDDVELRQRHSAEILRLMLLFLQTKHVKDPGREAFQEVEAHITLKQAGGTETSLPGFERLLTGWARDSRHTPYTFNAGTDILRIFLQQLDLSKPARSEVRSSDSTPQKIVTAEQKRITIVKKIRDLNKLLYEAQPPEMTPLFAGDRKTAVAEIASDKPQSKQSLGGDIRSMYLYYALRRAVMGEPPEDQKDADWEKFVPLLLEIATLYPELDPPVELSDFSLKLSSHPEINQVRIRLIKRLRMASMGEEQHESRGSRLHPVLISLLMIALSMGVEEARVEVIRTLPEFRGIPQSERNGYLHLLAAMYQDKRTGIQVKEAILEALGRYGARFDDLHESLIQWVSAIYSQEEENPRLQVAALKAFAQMGDFSEVQKLLSQSDREANHDLIIDFIKTLGSVKTAGAFDFLDSLVGNLEDEELIREVFVALRRQGTMAAYNLLQQKAFDGNTRLRAAALANLEPLAARQAAAIAAAHLSTFAEADDHLKDESLVGEDLIAMLDYLRLKQLTSSSESQNEPPVILNVFTQLQKFRDYQLVFTAAPDLFTLIFSFEEHPNMAVSEMAKRVSKQVSEWLDSTQGKTLVNAAIAIGYLSSRTERDLSPEQAALAIDALNTLASFENSLALLHLSPEVICTLAIYHDHSLESIRVAAQRALQRLVDDIRRDTEPAELSADEVYRSRIFEEFKALKAGDADGVRVVRNFQKILESMIPANGEVSPADDEKMRTWIPEIALKLTDPEVAGYFLNKADFSIQTLPRLIELQPAAFNESVLLRNLVRLTIQAALSDAAKDKELVSSGYVIQTIAEAIEKKGIVFPKGIYTQLKGQEEGLVKNLIHGVLKEWPAPDPERAGRLLERIGTAPLRFDQQLRWIRWMGGVGTALYAVLAFYFLAPVYPSYFLLVFAEGWGIVALTLWAGKYKGRFWTQLGTMTLGMAGLHGLFHHGMPMILPDLIYGPPVALGALLESIMIRSASVYISAWGAEEIERWFFKTKPTEPVSVRHQRYSKWSLAIGAASGYYIFDVALPFFEKATQSSTISGLGDMASTAFLRSAIDLGLASWITHTGLMIVLGGVFGEGQNVLRDFKKLYNPFLFFRTETGKKFILLIPLSFVIWVVPLFLLWYQFSGVNAGMKVFMVLVGTLWGFALKFVVGGSSILPNLDPIRTEARFEGINITFVVPEAGDVFKFGDLIQLTGAPAVAHEAALKIENRFPDYERLGSAPIPGQGNTIFLRRAAKRSEMRTTPQEADLRGFVNAFLNLTITKLKDRGIIFGMRKHLKTLYAQEEWRRRFVETELGGLDAAGKQKVMQSLLQTDGLQDFLVQLARWIGYTDQDSGIIKSPEFTALLYQALFLGEDAPLEYDGETKHFRLRGLSSRRFTSEDAKRYEESGQWRGVQIVVREPGATDDFEKGDFIEIMGPGADVARASHRILGDFKNYEYSFFTADATAQGRSKMGLKRKGVKVLDEAASHFDDFESVTSPSSASSDTKFEELLQDIERSLVEDGQEATEVRFVTKHDRTHHIQVTYARQPSADKKIQAAILDIRIFAPSQKMVITGQSDLSEAILGEVLAQLRARGISTNQMSEVKFSAKHEISLAGDDWGETQKQVMDVLRYVRLLLWQHLYASSGDASFKTRPLDGINNTPKFPVPSAEALIRFYDAFGTDGWKRLPGIPQRGGIPIGMMNLSPDIQKWYLNLIRGFGRNLKILSLGAGHGELEVALQNTGQQVTAVELSPKNGAILNAKNIKTIVGDANRKLDLPSDFDLVIFIDSIGQMNPRLALENAKDYLRPGGHIFMTTPTTDKPMTKQDYDNTLLVRYPLAYLQQILEMQGLDQLVQGYVPLSNANRASPQAFLQYISAHKPLETRSEVRADADASAHQTSAELEVQSGSARDHAEYAEFMREIKGKPMPLREKSYRESTPYQDLHVDLLLSDLKQADSRSRWQYGSATDKPKAAEPLSEYFDPSVEINFYGKKWRPKVAEINKRSKAPSRSASDIEQMHAYIRAALPIVKEEGGELEETLMSFYEAVRAYTYYWREFSKLKKDPKETRAAATAPSGSMWDEVSIDAWERQHDFYTSQHRHKAVFYFWRVIQTLDRVQRILEKPAYRDQIQHIPLAHAIRKISASSAVTQVRTYFNAYPPSEEDVPAVHPLVKVKRDSFSTRPTETAYRGWFREAANRRFKQGHSGFFYGDRNIKPLSPFWTLISGLHETGAELEFKPGELEEPELQARAQAFKALEDSLWDEDFGQRQRDVQNTFKRLKKPLEKLEFALGAARMIQESGYSLPEILREPGAIHLKKAWNPVAGSKSNMDLFDVDMDQDHNLYAVTGSNEIGKSTHVEMLGVIAFYSQIGLPVPAAAASMSLFRNVYTLVPSMQGVDVGESQHTGFIKQVKDLIKRVKSRDLVLIDEGHMGSDYKDLVGLTEVLMEDLLMTRATVGYATHLKDVPRRLAQKHSEVLLRRLMMRSENGWRWHRNLEEGVARLSGAVDTLRKTGYPQTILDSFESYFRALILEQPLVPTPLQELEPVRDRLRRRSGSSYDAKEDENILNQAMHSVYPSDYFSRGGYFYTLSQMA
ncbi:MAG: methyltransferase domain-containing protein, partial [Candidatus Omnitrophica bacterium]|nr:methyltransferase domain-containing protein [Candidatus Omnitrophota bacterium]